MGRRILALFAVVAVVFVVGLWAARPAAERRIADLIRREAAAAGATIGEVHFSWRAPLRLENVVLDREDTGRAQVDRAVVRWDYSGGRDFRSHVRGFDLTNVRVRRGNMGLELTDIAFDVVSWQVKDGFEHLRLRQLPAGGEFETRWRVGTAGREVGVSLSGLDLSQARVTWSGEELLRPGRWTGRLALSASGERLATQAELSAEQARFTIPKSLGTGGAGVPVAVHLKWDAQRDGPSVEVRGVACRLGGLQLTGRGRVDSWGRDPTIAATLAAQTELGAAFQATGMRLPVSLHVPPTELLGTAWFDLDLHGPLSRPAELRVVPRLRFQTAPSPVRELQYLRGPFVHQPDGGGARVELREGNPDFISIEDVPPLFLRALLISEDAGFYGHPGIDVAEIPVAWAENVERGTLRGASTITQQLVKNLFLSRDKTYGRKLEEAALALLVDAAVPKPRILEIYVNVIEWGPDLHGLVPAARHYFEKTPAELSPKEIAFLVCVIPSPVRYHQAHLAGHAGPGMEQLMVNLLAKLQSVQALGDDEYADALAEDLHFAPEPGRAVASHGDTP